MSVGLNGESGELLRRAGGCLSGGSGWRVWRGRDRVVGSNDTVSAARRYLDLSGGPSAVRPWSGPLYHCSRPCAQRVLRASGGSVQVPPVQRQSPDGQLHTVPPRAKNALELPPPAAWSRLSRAEFLGSRLGVSHRQQQATVSLAMPDRRARRPPCRNDAGADGTG